METLTKGQRLPLANLVPDGVLDIGVGEQGLEHLGTQFRIPLFNHFYRQR